MPEKEKLYTPEMLGFARCTEDDLDGGQTVEDAARIFNNVMTNTATPAQKELRNCQLCLCHPGHLPGKEDRNLYRRSPRIAGKRQCTGNTEEIYFAE